jgi:ATP phosphoribosyltransferase
VSGRSTGALGVRREKTVMARVGSTNLKAVIVFAVSAQLPSVWSAADRSAVVTVYMAVRRHPVNKILFYRK